MLRLSVLLLASASCLGCASHLRDDDGGVDASEPRRDAGPLVPGDDAGRDAGPGGGGTCRASMPFEIFRGEGDVRYPALARRGPNEAMLVFTRVQGDTPSVWALPITSNGNPTAAAFAIADGAGGTLVNTTFADAEPGFTLSFQDPGGILAAARMGPRGEDPASAPTTTASTSLRPMLVLTAALAANGWDEPGAPVGRGFVQDIVSRDTTDVTFMGARMRGVRGSSPDRFRVAAVLDGRGLVEEIDARGQRSGEVTTVEFDDRGGIPISAEGVVIVEEDPSAVVLWGGTIRALWDEVIHARLRGIDHEWFLADDLLEHSDAAFDPETEWLGVTSGVMRASAGHVFFHGLSASGDAVETLLAGPLPSPGPTHPAILETGPAEPTFLIVWEENDGTEGVLRGGHVSCD